MPVSADASLPCVQESSYLTLHYRIELLSLDGEAAVFADTFSGRPATLQMGSGQWAESLEARLLGLQEGDQLEFELSAAEAYGDRNPELVQKITKDLMTQIADPTAEFQPGDTVEIVAPNGGRYAGILKAFGDDWVMVDFNHPLAGHDLRIEVYLLGVL